MEIPSPYPKRQPLVSVVPLLIPSLETLFTLETKLDARTDDDAPDDDLYPSRIKTFAWEIDENG